MRYLHTYGQAEEPTRIMTSEELQDLLEEERRIRLQDEWPKLVRRRSSEILSAVKYGQKR